MPRAIHSGYGSAAKFRSMIGTIGFVWGVLGVVAFLGYAVVRLIPVAIEALTIDLSPLEWGGLAGSVASLGYYEGYRAFQKAFSPRTVARALAIRSDPKLHHVVLAPLHTMGLFHATTKRLVVSWSVLAGVTGLVVLVRELSQPWRGIVDAGVVVGLSWGVVSLLVYFALALAGRPMPVPPDTPAARVADRQGDHA
jgi:hypothetical protein